jgi:predicted small secreted protein
MKKLLALCISIILSASLCQAKEISGITMPEALQADGAALVLNGAGVRTKFFMDLYVGGLYLKQTQGDAEKIIAADDPMAIRLHIISSLITSEKMEAATREGFVNATGGAAVPLAERIESFIAVFREKINKEDVYEFVYAPGAGTKISKNGKLKTTIQGLDFKKALFGIWLCAKPAQQSLKEQMLGK